jgi:hypothetical protein
VMLRALRPPGVDSRRHGGACSGTTQELHPYGTPDEPRSGRPRDCRFALGAVCPCV